MVLHPFEVFLSSKSITRDVWHSKGVLFLFLICLDGRVIIILSLIVSLLYLLNAL